MGFLASLRTLVILPVRVWISVEARRKRTIDLIQLVLAVVVVALAVGVIRLKICRVRHLNKIALLAASRAVNYFIILALAF